MFELWQMVSLLASHCMSNQRQWLDAEDLKRWCALGIWVLSIYRLSKANLCIVGIQCAADQCGARPYSLQGRPGTAGLHQEVSGSLHCQTSHWCNATLVETCKPYKRGTHSACHTEQARLMIKVHMESHSTHPATSASAVTLLCRHQVASKDVPSPYEGAFPENIKS